MEDRFDANLAIMSDLNEELEKTQEAMLRQRDKMLMLHELALDSAEYAAEAVNMNTQKSIPNLQHGSREWLMSHHKSREQQCVINSS